MSLSESDSVFRNSLLLNWWSDSSLFNTPFADFEFLLGQLLSIIDY
jgi:hypothetical protein